MDAKYGEQTEYSEEPPGFPKADKEAIIEAVTGPRVR